MALIFPYIGKFIIPTDELIFFKGVETTNQYLFEEVQWFNSWHIHILKVAVNLTIVERTAGKSATLKNLNQV